MGVCILLRSAGIVSTGSDVTPDAINWANIAGYGGVATTSAESVAGIDTPITLKATWTGNARGRWIVSGASQSGGVSPVTCSVNNGSTLAFEAELDEDDFGPFPPPPKGPTTIATSGTVTVTNSSDSDAAIDTFTYYVEQPL